MTFTGIVLSPDKILRRTLFAVELVDPVTSTPVTDGLTVKAEGFSAKPIVNHSGRYVWLRDGDKWPGTIRVVPNRVPYAPHTEAPPPRPPDLDHASAAERLVRIVLRPTVAYPFESGVTAVRGCLRETAAPDAPPIADVRVQLAWHDALTDTWLPVPPAPEGMDSDAPGAPSPREIATTAAGDFVAFLRLRDLPGSDPDRVNGMLAVRLQFTRGRQYPITRATPADFHFLPESEPPPPTAPPLDAQAETARVQCEGRVFEGRLLSRELTVAWSTLNPI